MQIKTKKSITIDGPKGKVTIPKGTVAVCRGTTNKDSESSKGTGDWYYMIEVLPDAINAFISIVDADIV